MKQQILIIAGPTAVGKTEYSIRIAKALNGEIISADSMQLYRFMDIGSAKPSAEERSAVPHHLVDEVDPRLPWSAAEYQKLAKKYIEEVLKRGKLPVISGGTGLYVNSLLYDMDFSVLPRQKGFREKLEQEAAVFGSEQIHRRLQELDPAAAERIHPNNIKKIIRAIEVCERSGKEFPDFALELHETEDYEPILIGLTRDRAELYRRIEERVDQLLDAGLIEEVSGLLKMGLTYDDISMKGIGYKEIIGFLNGEYDKEEAVRLIKLNTRHYAKRQLTWFRRYPEMRWFDLSEYSGPDKGTAAILAYIKENFSLAAQLSGNDPQEE